MLENIEYKLSLIKENWHVICHITNREADMYFSGDIPVDYPSEQFQQYFDHVQKHFEENIVPEIYVDESEICFASFAMNPSIICFIGPFSPVPVSKEQLFKFYHKNKVKDKNALPVPCINPQEICPMLAMICHILTGRICSIEDITKHNFPSFHSIEELTMYKLDSELMDRQHLSYEYETQWLNSIEQGTPAPAWMEITSQAPTGEDFVGVLAKGNERKQLEYTFVAGITLASRAAMRGGIPPYEAYAQSDVFLQQLSQSKNTMEMNTCFNNAIDIFTEYVIKLKKKKRQNPYVEQCQDYIGRHLHSTYTIKDLANIIGVSDAYLSRLFAQCTGTTLHQYIIDTRLTASANMLRVAPATISEIAEYFCFCSPSHYGNCFVKKYQMTPSQYRSKYRVLSASAPIQKV